MKTNIQDLVHTPWKFMEELQPAEGFIYNKNRADFVVNWIQKYCFLTKAKWYGRPFKLLSWQKEIIRIFYGFGKFIDIDGQTQFIRQYRQLFINLPKKNGKSMFVSALALYHLIADGEKTPEVYSLAVDEKQARIIYDESKKMVDINPLFAKKNIKATQRPFEIRNKNNLGIFRPLSSKPVGKQGFSPSATFSDELHEFRTLDLYDSITSDSASITRTQPVNISTTTAGNDETGITKLLKTKSLEIQAGREQDPQFLGLVWAAKHYDKNNSLLIAKEVSPAYRDGLFTDGVLEKQDREAKLTEDKEERYKNWHLNLETRKGGSKRWIPIQIFNESGLSEQEWREQEIDNLFQRIPVYMGLDFGPQRDFTALAVIVKHPKTGIIYIKVHTWVTQTEIKRQQAWNKPFMLWQRKGYFEPDMIDRFDPEMLPVFLFRKFRMYKRIAQLGYDRSWILAEMKKIDSQVPFDCIDISNSYYGINEAANFFLDTLMAGKIKYKQNELLSYCAENTHVKRDGKARIMLDKSNPDYKIDPIVAIVMAIDCLIRQENKSIPKIQPLKVIKDRNPIFNKEQKLWQN